MVVNAAKTLHVRLDAPLGPGRQNAIELPLSPGRQSMIKLVGSNEWYCNFGCNGCVFPETMKTHRGNYYAMSVHSSAYIQQQQ